MNDVVSLDLAANTATISHDLPNSVLTFNGQSALNGISLGSTTSENACWFAPNITWDICTDTAVGYYSSNQEVKENPTNNQLSVKIRKKIKIRCSL